MRCKHALSNLEFIWAQCRQSLAITNLKCTKHNVKSDLSWQKYGLWWLYKEPFGTEELVPPGAIPDFSKLPLHQIISFFRDAKFKTLTMRPFFEEYLPTDTSNPDSNQELLKEKEAGRKKGDGETPTLPNSCTGFPTIPNSYQKI